MKTCQVLWIWVAILSFSLIAPSPLSAQSSTKAKATKSAGKKVGFAGDPARKRGLELGFDLGLKAGKLDKDQNKKPDPASHENFQKPEKYYRHEFGSQGNFVSGFKSGFVGGYSQAFGKKVTARSSDGSTITGNSGASSVAPKKPKAAASTAAPSNPSSDAL